RERGPQHIARVVLLRHRARDVRADAEIDDDREEGRVAQGQRELSEPRRTEEPRLCQDEDERRRPRDRLTSGDDRDVPQQLPDAVHAAASCARAASVRYAVSPSETPRTIIVRLYVRPRSTDENTTWIAMSTTGTSATSFRSGERRRRNSDAPTMAVCATSTQNATKPAMPVLSQIHSTASCVM